jgi:radical SAM superfamily enzyme YgiQ (UPF0313 family)
MPKKIVLIEPEYEHYKFNYLPQGLLSLAGSLRCKLFDIEVLHSPPIPSCDVLGISATTPQYNSAISIARGAYGKADLVVLGGSHVTTAPVEAMKSPFFDIGIVGDGEDAFARICMGAEPSSIPGVVYRKSGMLVMNPNLDIEYGFRSSTLPYPAYDFYTGEIGSFVNVSRNREWSWKNGWRLKNRPKWWRSFSAEMGILRDLGVREVFITDENFGCWHSNIKTTISTLDAFDSWHCRTSVSNALKKRLDYKLLSTNCRSVEIDCVSGNERLLNRFGDHTVEEARLAVELLCGIGINVTLHVTIGFPGETIDSMVDTWKFISGNSARISTLSPWPGTEFYEESCRYYEFDFCVNALSWPAFDANRNPGLPWSMNTIKPLDFLEFRSKMKQGVYNGE